MRRAAALWLVIVPAAPLVPLWSRQRVFSPLRASSLSDDDLARLCEEEYLVVPQFLDAQEVAALRSDAMALRESGAFVQSKVGTRQYRDGDSSSTLMLSQRTRLSETAWLRPPVTPDQGDVNTRRELDTILEDLRCRIARATGEAIADSGKTSAVRSVFFLLE